MSNQANTENTNSYKYQQPQNFTNTQITVQNYDQLNEISQQNLDEPQIAVGGRYDFDDGGLYVGGWYEGKANGYGICTGPNCQGEYSGSWHFGFEVSGVYKWPQGTSYQGQWQNGRRHGLGVEYRGNWVFKGEWTQGTKGRYGVKCSLLSPARYEGTWANGLQDGYGSETYADGGNYQGQWCRGMRHGFGVRTSASYGAGLGMNTMKLGALNDISMLDKGSTQSLDVEGRTSSGLINSRDANMVRGGFVLSGKLSSSSDLKNKLNQRRNSAFDKEGKVKTGFFRGLRLKKQRSTGDIDMPMNVGLKSVHPSGAHSVTSSTDSISLTGHLNRRIGREQIADFSGQSTTSFNIRDNEIMDPTVTETYMGEWKEDKRTGFGICERSDGLQYAGEWYKNQKHGYGVTTFPDGSTEEGKYKNNVLVLSSKKKIVFVIRPTKLKERIDSTVEASNTAQQTAMKKADIAISRTATARDKAEQAVLAADVAQNDSKLAILAANQFGGLVIDPSTNTISPSSQNIINSSDSLSNLMKGQSNLLNLGDGQLIVPEVPLRRRLSDINTMRKSITRQSLKESKDFNDLHKINESTNKLEPKNVSKNLDSFNPFPGRQTSIKKLDSPTQANYQMYQKLNNPHSDISSQIQNTQSYSSFNHPTNSPQSYHNSSSQHNVLGQSDSIHQLSTPDNQLSQQPLNQSQPHLMRQTSSPHTAHHFTTQRSPLNTHSSFDLDLEQKSMVDHTDHYLSLLNRYASTSKINQTSSSQNKNFSKSTNLQNVFNTKNLNQMSSQNKVFDGINNNQNMLNNRMVNLSLQNNSNPSLIPNLKNYQQSLDSGLSLNDPIINQQQFSQNSNQSQFMQPPYLRNQFQQQTSLNQQFLLNQQQQQQLQSSFLQQQSSQAQQMQQAHSQFNEIQQPQSLLNQQQSQSHLNQQQQSQSQFLQKQQLTPSPQQIYSQFSQPQFQQSQQQLNQQQQQQSPSFLMQQNPQLHLQQPLNSNMMQFSGMHPTFQAISTQNLTSNQSQLLTNQQSQQFNMQPHLSIQQFNSNNLPNNTSQTLYQNITQQQQQQAELINTPFSQAVEKKHQQLQQEYSRHKQDDSLDNDQPKRNWRSASLHRPAIISADSIKSKNDTVLKRKPSLQTNFNKDTTKPIMSREEVSIMSSAEREHRRKKAELAAKLARNPFLYFMHSQFRDWLVEQQLILIVLAINSIVAFVCYNLLFTKDE